MAGTWISWLGHCVVKHNSLCLLDFKALTGIIRIRWSKHLSSCAAECRRGGEAMGPVVSLGGQAGRIQGAAQWHFDILCLFLFWRWKFSVCMCVFIVSLCVHLCVNLPVHVGCYLYQLFAFSCLYLVAVFQRSPLLLWPTSCAFWLSQIQHGLQTQHLTSTIKLS